MKFRLRGYHFDVWFSVPESNLEVGCRKQVFQMIPKAILSTVAICKFRDAKLDFARKLLRCGWTIVDDIPGLNIEPLPELIQRYLARKVAPKLMPNIGKQVSIHGG
jgi:hypothetical protein